VVSGAPPPYEHNPPHTITQDTAQATSWTTGEPPIRRVRRELVYDARRFRVVRDRQALPDGREVDWELALFSDAALALPFDGEGHVYLVEQYRPAADGLSLEVPSGVVEPGETPAAAAARELREELGMTARLVPLGSSGNGVATFVERLHFFIGRITARGEPQLDPFERLVFRGVRRLAVAEAVDLCLGGGILQTSSCAAILLAAEHVRRHGLPE
jgi:ADP-ribose pyrophosphatase